MNLDDDSDLRARFDALKRLEEASTPPFEAVLNRPRRHFKRSRRRPITLAVAIGAIVALILAVQLLRAPGTAEQPEMALPAWPQTTESLLVAIAAPPVIDWSQLPSEALDRLPKLSKQEKR